MTQFKPDYQNLIDAARNVEPRRVPLYEHVISFNVMEKITNSSFAHLVNSTNMDDLREFFRQHNHFFKTLGYDTISWESFIGPIMPGSGALGEHKPGVIKNRKDFDEYPWGSIEDRFFDAYSDRFQALRDQMPEGMKAVGGPGNGIFECVQDIVGYQDLCLLSADDPVLYSDLFSKVGDVNFRIWKRFLDQFGDIYAVCRFGDDLGFRSSTLISARDIKEMIIPQYKRIVELVHSYDKPFLLHSCGCIFNVMDDIIKIARIDAKHSNEDAIGPFSVWIEKYGDRIGNFGGIDMDVLCQSDPEQIKQYIFNVMDYSKGHGGIAIGSGNSIPDYVPTEGYLAMINAVRECRGDF